VGAPLLACTRARGCVAAYIGAVQAMAILTQSRRAAEGERVFLCVSAALRETIRRTFGMDRFEDTR